jgi:hypothetical protein
VADGGAVLAGEVFEHGELVAGDAGVEVGELDVGGENGLDGDAEGGFDGFAGLGLEGALAISSSRQTHSPVEVRQTSISPASMASRILRPDQPRRAVASERSTCGNTGLPQVSPPVFRTMEGLEQL